MKLINKSIRQNLHLYFLYLFLLSIPFQTRKIFLTEYSFYSGAFTEWTTIFLYVSDIFLIPALVFWIIAILKNSQSRQSSAQLFNYYKDRISALLVIPAKAGIYCYGKIKLFSQVFVFTSHRKKGEEVLSYINTFLVFLRNKWLFLFIFLLWLVLNLAINKEYLEISAFQVAKFIELSFLMIFIYFNLQNSKVLINSLFILAFSGFLQSLIAIYQFITQHSAFSSPILAKIIGESIIGPQIPGVAKILVDSNKIIRAYGTFPHPNVLGGFLVFTILITIYLYLEHKKYNLSSIRLNLTYRNLDFFAEQRQVNACSSIKQAIYFEDVNSPYNTKDNKSQTYIDSMLWILFLSAQFIGLFFTFSRSAWLGLLISLLMISAFYFYNYKIVSRETLFDKTVNNFSRAFYKFMNVSRETINNKITKQRLENCLYKFKNIKASSFFVIPAKAGIYCYNKIKPFSQILILNLILPTLKWISDKFLRRYHKIFWNNKTKKGINVIGKRDSDNNITLFNRLSTVFQHNIYIKSIIKYKELFIALMIMIVVISINLPFVSGRLDVGLYNESSAFGNSSINERIFYNNVSRETISNNFIFGSGVGTFIFQIDNYLQANGINQKLQPWQYQPAHNIYLLTASEIGIMGLILFLLLIINILCNLLSRNFNVSVERKRHYIMSLAKKFLCIRQRFKLLIFGKNNVSRETLLENYSSLDRRMLRGVCEELQDYSLTIKNKIVSRETICNNLNIYLIAILIAFLFIGIFDHYFWTLQQGRLMFWLVLGLMLSVSNYKK